MLLTTNLGDAKTFSIPLRWGNRQFVPGTEWNLTFTAKSQPNSQLDSAASLQKQTDSGILVVNNKAKVSLLPQDTTGTTVISPIAPGLLYWDIQAQKIEDPLEVRTVAKGKLALNRDVTRGISTYIPAGPSFSSSVAKWTLTNDSSKNAYSALNVVNTSGVTISLVASNGSDGITNAKISLNSVELAGTYSSTGTWPNLSINIPSEDLTGNVANYANSVTIRITGLFNSLVFNIQNAGALTNIQPVSFAASLSASYLQQLLPFYATTATVNYNYSIANGTITQYNGIITAETSTPLDANVASGTFTGVLNRALTLSGSVTGTGTFGAGSTTLPIGGQVSAVSVYYPAFYKITNSSVEPTWLTTDTQTVTSPTGLTITYPNAQETDYAWLATRAPMASIVMIVQGFGEFPIPATVISSVVIAGQVFDLYGFTGFVDGVPVRLKFNSI